VGRLLRAAIALVVSEGAGEIRGAKVRGGGELNSLDVDNELCAYVDVNGPRFALEEAATWARASTITWALLLLSAQVREGRRCSPC